MAQLNTNLPAPAADGVGAWVDVSAYGALKTILVSGDHDAIITIEISNAVTAADASAAPLVGFNPKGKKTLNVAARWMRVRVSNYNVHVGGQPVVDVGGDDAGTEFAELVAPAGNGVGASVDVSGLLMNFKTVHVGNAFRGSLQLEVSNDGGTTWSQILSFDQPGLQSAVFSAQFMRLRRNGVPRNTPGLPVVNVGFCSDGGSGGAGGGGDRGWYGTGIHGDHTTAGNETWDEDKYYLNLTILAGHTVRTANFKLAVADTLTIEEGGFLDNSGTGTAATAPGTLLAAGSGGDALAAEVPQNGAAGESPAWWPRENTPIGSGGNGGDTPSRVGGAGGTPSASPGYGPYTIEQIAAGFGMGGGAGGGGGASDANPSAGGDGGAGGGPMVIKARYMDVADNSIVSRGADGNAGTGTAGGGGGGQGGQIAFITDEETLPVCDVAGGSGGAAGGSGGDPGTDGDDGIYYGISPIHGPLA